MLFVKSSIFSKSAYSLILSAKIQEINLSMRFLHHGRLTYTIHLN